MRTFITYQQYLANSIQSRVGYDVDQFSRQLTGLWLKCIGAENIQFTEGNNCSDILADINGKKVAIECKDRSYKYFSYSFGDHFIEKVKLQSLYKRKTKGEFTRMGLVSLFKDGVLAVTGDLEHQIKATRTMKCPKTTTLGDTSEIDKPCIIYDQNLKVYFCFYTKENDPVLYVYFSLKPINVPKLNEEEQKASLYSLEF